MQAYVSGSASGAWLWCSWSLVIVKFWCLLCQGIIGERFDLLLWRDEEL